MNAASPLRTFIPAAKKGVQTVGFEPSAPTLSPALAAKSDAINATLAKALAPSEFIGPRLPAVSVGKTRYCGVWMPPVSAYIRANERGERMTYPASHSRGLPMGEA